MYPRPALKACTEGDRPCTPSPFPFASSSTMLESPHVHFPPTPTMTSTALTHSPHVYDRAPIRVAPNNCALPERGDRVYDTDDVAASYGSPLAKECYFGLPRRPQPMQSSLPSSPPSSLLFNSRVVNPAVPSHDRYDISSPPLLGSDVSSESEDSDQCKSPPDPSTPRIPFVSVRLANTTAPYPYGGIPFASEQSIGIPNDLVPLPFTLHPKAKKKSSLVGGPQPVEEGAGTPLKKRVKKDSVSLPAGERTRRLSNTTRCIATVTTTSYDAPPDCLGGF